jgi:hypothetical protein
MQIVKAFLIQSGTVAILLNKTFLFIQLSDVLSVVRSVVKLGSVHLFGAQEID